jgi:hypothetical protein
MFHKMIMSSSMKTACRSVDPWLSACGTVVSYSTTWFSLDL